jgi:hypothetical protein
MEPTDAGTEQDRGGLFPDIDKVSKDWQVILADQSTQWQAKIDHLTALIESLIGEIRALRGVTVTIDRTTPPNA